MPAHRRSFLRLVARHRFVPGLCAALFMALAPASLPARDTSCTPAAACAESLTLTAGGYIRVYRSLPLTHNDTVVRAVLVIHGNARNADDYFDFATEAAGLEHKLAETLVLAPNFRTRKDEPGRGEHYWSSHGWKIGNRSLDAARVSSFAVMDELLGRICPTGPAPFPNLRTVVIAGHSAGAQFVNRYLAGGAGCPNRRIEVRYIVMNPSSYLYVDDRRRADPDGTFATPRAGCSGFDDYKYGLRELNTYMRRVGAAEIRRRMFTRSSWYLAGGADTRAGRSLDQRCEARLQGANRLVRHINYRDYAGLFDAWTGAQFVTVPGIGHSGRAMLVSEPARQAAFR